MRIGFVFDDSLDRNDGVQQYIKTIADWLMDNGHEVRFLVGDTRDAGKYQPYVYSLARNISVRANRNRLTIPLPTSKRRINEVLDKEGFDLLHVQAPYSPMFAHKVIVAAPPDCAVVATFHIVESSAKERAGIGLLRMIEKNSLKRIDVNLANSLASKRSAARYFMGNIFICPNPVDIGRFAIKAEHYGHGWSLAFLGRLVDRKGCKYLLEALKRLAEDRPDIDWNLRIGGDGPLRSRLEAFVDDNDLKKRVRFLGFIRESDKAQFLASADIAVFPSLYGESFGIVLIESMAAGTLTLGGDNPGYRTVMEGSEISLFNPKNVEQLAERLIALHDHAAECQHLLAWQRDRVKLFDIGTVGPQLMEHYHLAQARACQSAVR